METLVLEVDPGNIAMFKAIVESYDNLLTLRTEDPIHHHLKMWFDCAVSDDVETLLEALRKQFPIRVLRRS